MTVPPRLESLGAVPTGTRFCPCCGRPWAAPGEPAKPRRTEIVTRSIRPMGIVLGLLLCLAGAGLLAPQVWEVVAGPIRQWLEAMRQLPSLPFASFHPFWWQVPWGQALGLLLLAFGLVELIFGSRRQRRTTIIER